jgi:hypothetical protein
MDRWHEAQAKYSRNRLFSIRRKRFYFRQIDIDYTIVSGTFISSQQNILILASEIRNFYSKKKTNDWYEDQLNKITFSFRRFQIFTHTFIVWKNGSRSSNFRTHITNGTHSYRCRMKHIFQKIKIYLPVHEIDWTPGPKYSMMAPVPPLTVKIPASLRITSFGDVHPLNWPVSRTPITWREYYFLRASQNDYFLLLDISIPMAYLP